jgi:hypothetical protein
MAGKIQLGKSTSLDSMKLLEGRMLVVGNSGSGKSYLLRVLCEQVVDKIPTIILDREGEFSTLREKHDVALIGEGGEADVSVSTAAKLARTLVELGISAVINLSDLPSKTDKRRFVRVFLDALLALPRSLWRPMIVIVDEAHDFCPETGREAESRESVVRLMDSGRKRGICGILATQRFAKLAKDAAAEANNVCVGHIVQDVDLKRASDILGFSGRSEWATLRDLEAGQWFAFGPAFAHRGIEKFTGSRATTTHPKPGERHKLKPPAPSRSILKVAPELQALKVAVAAEQDEIVRLRAENKELRSRRSPVAAAAPVDTTRHVLAGREDVLRMVEPAVASVLAARTYAFEAMSVAVAEAKHQMELTLKDLVQATSRKNYGVPRVSNGTNGKSTPAPASLRKQQTRPALHPTDAKRMGEIKTKIRADAGIADPALGRGGMRRLMVVIAQHPEGVERTTLGLLAQIPMKGGTFSTYMGRLRSYGWVRDEGTRMFATDAGIAALGEFEPLPTGADAARYWLDWCGRGGQRRILEVLLEAGPAGIDREELIRRSNINDSGGTFSTYLGRLRTARLVEGRDRLKITACIGG